MEKKKKTTSFTEKFVATIAISRHFAYMQIRRIPAVTHIKILFVEHAQTKCLYAIR